MLVGPTIAIIFGVVILLIILISAIKILREYERGVIFRFGRLRGTKGPGIFLIIPFVDKMIKVDLRTVTMDVPPQDVITKDNVPVKVNAVVYFRVMDPAKSVVKIERYMVATSQIAQTTLRSILGQAELDDLLSRRDKINKELQKIIDDQTDPWGVKVSVVEVKDVELPQTIQRAFARQAEAERERRAKIINAEGEFQASERLSEAARVLSKYPISVQLRFLQTLKEIATEQNSTIVFPVPVDLIQSFIDKLGKK
jgi:regulator of protease activity HflC (stomatin/prohibitin superfamily)